MGLENHTAKELLKGNLRLVSALWLMQRPPGWTVQKLQDLPEEALLPPETAAEMFLNPWHNYCFVVPRVVALSYRWLTPEHPDPDGVQLKQARQFLSKLLGYAAGREDVVDVKDVDVGVLWDFMSLPQQPRVTEDLKEAVPRRLVHHQQALWVFRQHSHSAADGHPSWHNGVPFIRLVLV